MHTNFYIIHAEWCPHCVTLLDTMKTIGGYPSKNGEYNVNGTIIRAIEQKELENPETKTILGDRHIEGFPTILVKNNNNFDEYNGSRDNDSLIQLFSKHKKPKKYIKNQRRHTRKTGRKTRRKTGRKIGRKTGRKIIKKPTSWLF